MPGGPPPVSPTDPIIINDYSSQEVFDGAMDINNAQSKQEGLSITQTRINLVSKKN